MRLFIAIEVPDAWRRAALAQQRALRAALPAPTRPLLRAVPPERLHLTVRFLGDVAEADLAPLQAELGAVAPFAIRLALGHAGTFGPAARAAVAWLGVVGEVEALREVARDVEHAVRRAGLPGDDRPLAPHLTLARVARPATVADRRAVAEAVRALTAPPPASFVAARLALIRSTLGAPAPRYEVLSRHP